MYDDFDEEYAEATDALQYEVAALQDAINGRAAWDMEGSYGRAMMQALEDGYCVLGVKDYHRAYGLGHIPSRTQVKKGTKGSIEYARHAQPDFWSGRPTDWADA